MGQQTQQTAEISNNNHQIIKITWKQQAPLCLKIFSFEAGQANKIFFYRNHFEGVKQWMKMRFSGKSFLKILDKVEVNCMQSNVKVMQEKAEKEKVNKEKVEKEKVNKEKVEKEKVEKEIEMINIHVQTDFIPFPTLFQYLEGQANSGASVQPEKIDFYLYYTVELFEAILRGGSIPNFFYTPNNLFIDRPKNSHDSETGTFVANYMSTVGLDLLFLGEDIRLTDLEEIFPLLPSNLKQLMDNRPIYQKQLNRIIKMKGLAWNLFCFLMKEVPNIIVKEQQKSHFSLNEIFSILQKHQSQSPMLELLKYHEKQLQLMRQQTGIKYYQLFKSILVNNCRDVTWDSIYKDLFLSHLVFQKSKKYNQQMRNEVNKTTGKDMAQVKDNVSKEILKQLWNHDRKKEQIKRFYEERYIRGGSMVYFLVRTNVKFQNMMRHLNVLEFIDNTCFCDELVKVHLNFIESSIQALPDLKKFKMPYSGVPPPNNMQSQEASIYMSLTSPQEIIAGLRRQVGKRRQFIVQHHSITTINQLNNALFHVY